VLIEAVDGADIRMIERRGGARLAAEALDRFFARGVAHRQDFQRDLAAELCILRTVHHAHPASTQLVEDLVVPEYLTDQRCRHSSA